MFFYSLALCNSFGYSLSSGYLVTQSDLSSTSSLHCELSRGGTVQSMGNLY